VLPSGTAHPDSLDEFESAVVHFVADQVGVSGEVPVY
jgi:hypothetical protein